VQDPRDLGLHSSHTQAHWVRCPFPALSFLGLENDAYPLNQFYVFFIVIIFFTDLIILMNIIIFTIFIIILNLSDLSSYNIYNTNKTIFHSNTLNYNKNNIIYNTNNNIFL